MTSEIYYNGNLRTTATHLQSGNQLITDAPTDNNGNGDAFSPTDLVATALGSCILTIMGITAKNHSIDMEDAKVTVNKVMASNPRRIQRLEVDVYMPDKQFSKKEMIILEKAAHMCPVANSLHPDLKEIINVIWD